MLNVANVSGATNSKPDELQVLWQRIEKHQKRNQNLTEKINRVFQIFENKVLPLEHELVTGVISRCEHLASFSND